MVCFMLGGGLVSLTCRLGFLSLLPFLYCIVVSCMIGIRVGYKCPLVMHQIACMNEWYSCMYSHSSLRKTRVNIVVNGVTASSTIDPVPIR